MSVAEPPSIINKKGKNYVYFGDNNLYPYYLVGLYESSPTHGAIINGKVKYIVGRGLFSEDEATDNLLQIANKNESWSQVLFKLAMDYEIHNRYYIEVVRRRGGGKSYYHLDASRVRVDDEEQVWYYSDDWRKDGRHNSRPNTVKFIKYDAKRIKPITDGDVEYRELIPYEEYRPNFESYAYPNYMNVLLSIEAEAEISNYDLNQWKNGFLGSAILNFNSGEPDTEEAKTAIEKTVKDTIGGSGGKKILINYSDNKDNAATITGAKGEDSASEADMASKRISRTIFTGHTITSPTLLGVMNESAFSGNAELAEAYELFKETYIVFRQKTLITSIENAIGIDGVEIEELRKIKKVIPIAEIAPYLTSEETRKIVLEEYGIEEAGVFEPIEPVEEVAFSNQSENDLVLQACKKYGRSKDNFIEVAGKGCEFEDGKLKFADLSDLDLWILSILNDNPNFSATEIAENAKENGFTTSVIDVFERLGVLSALNWIAKNGSEYILSRLGEREADKVTLPEVKLETVYAYELRPDAPTLSPGGKSRQWCKDMVGLKRFYTKEEITSMSNDLNTNVWMTRGGWYTKRGTNISLPFCRHWWAQKIVKAK